MSDFKVGDIVRVLSNKSGASNEEHEYFKVGDITRVTEVDRNDCRIGEIGYGNWIKYSEIELVERDGEPVNYFKKGDKVRMIKDDSWCLPMGRVDYHVGDIVEVAYYCENRTVIAIVEPASADGLALIHADRVEPLEEGFKFKEGDVLVENGNGSKRKRRVISLDEDDEGEMRYLVERLTDYEGMIASGEVHLDKGYVEEHYELDKYYIKDDLEREFKKGDFVVAVRDVSGITIGKPYKVLNTFEGWVRIENDNGLIDGYHPNSFNKAKFKAKFKAKVKVHRTGIPTPNPSVLDFTPDQLEEVAELRRDIAYHADLASQKQEELDELLGEGGGGRVCIL